MFTNLLGRSGTLRLLIGAFVLALVPNFMLAPPAHAADNWSGVWQTHHQFGDPKLRLDFDKREGPDYIAGTYKNSDGTTGKIHGDVVRDGGAEVWTGKFHDDNGASKGKFRVVLQSDQVSFVGWFKTCGTFTCSDKYHWAGEHA